MHGARSEHPKRTAQKEPAAATRSSKRQKASTSKAAEIVKPKKGGKGKANEPKQQPPSACKSFYLHEVYVFSSSQYFRTLLETPVGGFETEMSTVGRSRPLTILHDYVEDGEMEAVELVLKSFYDQGKPPLDTLPSEIDIKVPLLLKALMVAERYQADRCKEKIAEALSSIPTTDLTLQLAKTVYLLPEPILDLQQMNGIRSNIKTKFYSEMFLSSVIDTIKEPELLNAFLALPYASVLEWIKRDYLKVHSENDVVYLLSKWIEKNQPPLDQRFALAREIRVVNLGIAYLQSTMPIFLSFNYSASPVLHKYLKFILMARQFKGNIQAMKSQMSDLPASWLSAPRKAPGYTPPASTAFTWILKEDQLKELYDGTTAVYSEPVYHNGHWIKGFAYRDKPEGVDVCSLYCGLDIYGGESQDVVPLSVTISIGKVGAATERKCSGTCLLSENGLGWTDFLYRKCPTIQEVVAPYLVDGKLAIKNEISKVDE